MALQPINFTSIKRGWRKSTFHSSANRGPATAPSLTTQPMQIHLKHAIEHLLVVVKKLKTTPISSKKLKTTPNKFKTYY